MGEKKKLNIFQRGILQFLFSVLIASVFMYAGLIAFLKLYSAGLFSQNAIVIFFGFVSSLMIVALSFLLMRMTFGANLATKITLPKIVEFSHALQNIGINRFDEQIDFIAREKVFLFVSDDSIVPPCKENASVKRYIFLKDKERLKNLNGDKRLCLDADDYERLLDEHGAKTKTAYEARIAALEKNISELKAANSIQTADIAKLTEEKESLAKENAGYRKTQQTAAAREENAEKREIRRIPFWRVAGPLVNRLIAEATPETQYTRPQIQAAFLAELDALLELKPAIEALLNTKKKEDDETPYDLTGWGMEAIRTALGDHVQKDGRAPKKG